MRRKHFECRPSRSSRAVLTAVAVTIMALGLSVGSSGTARAAAPSNDDFANAVLVSSVPLTQNVDLTEATAEAGEPQEFCNYVARTVWYAITPSESAELRADADGSDFSDTAVHVYRDDGGGLQGLTWLGCHDFGGFAQFDVEAGRTYYVQVGKIYGGSGTLHFSLQQVLPPPNDDFANAVAVGSLPFSDVVDTTLAGVEPDEPVPSCGPVLASASAWYAYTPGESGSVSATATSSYPMIAAYAGNSMSDLTEIGCFSPPWALPLTIQVVAGNTYYFQVGFGPIGPFTFTLEAAAAPQPVFWSSPSDPSQFDTLRYYDWSYDPANVGIESRLWGFGDGATATEANPTHQYTFDGDYTVELSVTTYDGRFGSLSQVVSVRTHDVAIAKLAVPQTASARQTRSITVSLTDKRYPESVEVQLFRSTLNTNDPYELVGTQRQAVLAHSGGKTTNVSFPYTFTADDAAIGKVTFKAVATIIDARDALPADNTAIALPTRVGR